MRLLTKVNVDQFYGIEIDEFPSRIAQVALWMTDHIANVNLGEMFGRVFPDMPIVAAPHVHYADALEIDWNTVLPAHRCAYVLGNPPFVGARLQSASQRAQVVRLARGGGSAGALDYVTAWFVKAGDYVRDGMHRSPLLQPTAFAKAIKSHSFGPAYFMGVVWKSPSRTEHSLGRAVLESTV